MPKGLSVAVVPGVEALIVLFGQLWRDAGNAGRGARQFRVQQAPAKMGGQVVGKLAAARTVLALDSDDTDRCVGHGDDSPCEWRIQRICAIWPNWFHRSPEFPLCVH